MNSEDAPISRDDNAKDGGGKAESLPGLGTNRITDDIRGRMSSLRPKAAEGVQHAADAARRAAKGVGEEEAWVGQLLEQGAGKLSELADTLRTNNLQNLLGKVEQFARRKPVLFAGAAMALGFALTRAAAAAAAGADESNERKHSDAGQ